MLGTTPSQPPLSWPATSAGVPVSRAPGPTPTVPAGTAPGARKEGAGRDELDLIRLFHLLHWRPEAIAPLLRIMPDATACALRRSGVSEGSIRALTEFAEGPKAIICDSSFPFESSSRLLDLLQPARTSPCPEKGAEWTSDT